MPDSTARLLVLKARHREDACSPESRYLVWFDLAQARRVYADVECVVLDDEAETANQALAIRASQHVLIVGNVNVFLGAASLARMRAALEAGADVAVPRALEEHPIDETPYSLRGYERLEHHILEALDEPATRDTSPLPLSLVRGDVAAKWLARHGLRDLLERAETSWMDGVGVVRSGIFFRFVDYYAQAREDVIEHLPPGSRDVLEIGCGRGLTGERIQQRLGCQVTGIELNPEAARAAATRLHRVLSGDVTAAELGGPYDAVVATELFEHLIAPEELLVRLRAVLRPGGRIILSVPNVGHFSVVEDLLAGRWDYLPAGLLCSTHVRFFTRTTLEDWITRSGFPHTRIVAQRTELPQRVAALAERIEVDAESLATSGFYVLIDV